MLIRTARGHNASARAFWAMYAPRLLAYARSVLAAQNAQAQAEDVLQIVMCKILKIPTYRLGKINSVDAWLFAVTRSSALNHMRGERREASRRKKHDPSATIHEQMPPSSYDMVRSAVEALAPEEAEIMTLRHAGGLSFGQISELIGVPRSTIASRYKRALARLREVLDPERESHAGSIGEAGHG